MHRNIRQMHRDGFTLLEIMIVVIIIGLLAGVAAVKLGPAADKGRVAGTRASIAAVKTAVLLYEVELGRYPDRLDELVIEGDENWPGPFLEQEEIPNDGWGHPFRYEIIGKRVRISSPGKDGEFGTADDLKSQ